MKNKKAEPKLAGIGWIVVAIITIVWLIIQQIQINEFKDELAEVVGEKQAAEERASELAEEELLMESTEYLERIARENGFMGNGEVVVDSGN